MIVDTNRAGCFRAPAQNYFRSVSGKVEEGGGGGAEKAMRNSSPKSRVTLGGVALRTTFFKPQF